MAAAWSSGARGFSAANVSSLATASFTISGTDRYLEVLVYSGAGSPVNVSSVVWDAAGANEALTQVESYITSNTYFRSSKWALVNPTAGTSKTVTVTWTGAQDETMVIADSYTGIDQTTPARTRPTPGQGTSSTPTLSVTSVADDLVVGAAVAGISAADLTTISSSAVTVREKIEGADIGNHEQAVQGDVLATGTSTSVGFQLDTTSTTPVYVIFGAALIPAVSAPTATIVTGSATMGVGIAETYTYKLDFSPAGTVTVTPTAPVAGSWSPTTVGLTSGNWNTGLTSDFTASAAGSGNISSTNDGGLTNDTLAVTVYSTSRPSAVTAGSWTDEAGGSLVVTDINDASDSTGAKDPAGASYPVLAFTMDTPMAASVSQTCYFRGDNVAAGKQVRQVLFANDGTTVVATGAWHTMTGSLATYSDTLTPTATAYKGEIQTQAVPSAVYGVIWPSNPDTNSDVRLNWTGSASVSRTAQTIIWKSNYVQQDGYYAVWWRLPDAASSFTATEWHFGTHPWPGSTSVNGAGEATGGTGSTGTVHQQEIATIGASVDYITSPSAANGGPFTVTKGVWITSAATVEVISGTTLRHTYWPDISNTTSFIRQDRTLASLNTPTSERVVFGGSPWTADDPTSGKNSESASGTFRYWKMFSAALSITDIATEAASESDSAVTTAGIASEFYSNINPTPTDVTDKSGNGNDPAWANSNRPTLYTG